VMSSATALANGSPMGAALASAEVGAHLTPGSHASTFGGNALGAAVALASLAEIGRVLPESRVVSERLMGRLRALPGERIAEVRGRGMLIGVILRGVDAAKVVSLARERALLVNAIGSDVVRLAPPLTLAAAEADQAVERLGAAIAAA